MKEINESRAIDFNEIKRRAVEDLKAGKSLLGSDGSLTPLIKQIIEESLEGELEAHFSESEELTPNRRNGKSRKVIKSHVGSFELETPRERNGTFEPQLVKKRQTILNAALDDKILALFSLGMSSDDISKHLQEMYGVEISKATISAVTDRFHAVRLMQSQCIETYKEIDPELKSQRGLIKALRIKPEHLSAKRGSKRNAYFEKQPAIEAIYEFKQKLYQILMKKTMTARRCRKYIPIFLKILNALKGSGFKHLVTLGKTLSHWKEAIVCRWRFTKSNGITEGFIAR